MHVVQALSGDPQAILDVVVIVMHDSGIINDHDFNNISDGLQLVSIYFNAGNLTMELQQLAQTTFVINGLADAGIIPPEIATYINMGSDILNASFGQGTFYGFADIIKIKLADLYHSNFIPYGTMNSIIGKIDRAMDYLAAGKKGKARGELTLAKTELLNNIKMPASDRADLSQLIDWMIALI